MELTRKYLEAVDSITLQHSGCDCEVTGEWLAQDGDAIIKIDKCKCVERPIGGVGETGVTVQEGEHEDWDVGSRSVTVQDTQQERS